MGDWANAVVKFKVKPEFKDALRFVFDKQHKRCAKDLEWFDYFSFITVDGKIAMKNYSDNEYCYFEGMGYNINLEDNFSLGESIEQDLDGDIAIIKMAKKWTSIERMETYVSENLECIADEVYICEIVAPSNRDEKYYHTYYDVTIDKSDGYTDVSLKETKREKVIYEGES